MLRRNAQNQPGESRSPNVVKNTFAVMHEVQQRKAIAAFHKSLYETAYETQ